MVPRVTDTTTVLFEDRDLLVVNKPAGMVVIPARAEAPEACLLHRLQAARAERLWVVHRIDRDTSGVVLFARTAEAHRSLNAAFAGRAVHKQYLALARGSVPEPNLRHPIRIPLHTARKNKMRPAHPGEADSLEAQTDLSLVARYDTSLGPLTLVHAMPVTGRQHQLRVHLRAIGCPLLVDPLYGHPGPITGASLGIDPAIVLARTPLHAATLTLTLDGAPPRTFTAPRPPDLRDLLDALDASAPLGPTPAATPSG